MTTADPLRQPGRTAPPSAPGAALALELNAEGAAPSAPEWIMLYPTGRVVVGRDGRRFSVADPAAVIAATRPHLPLPIDYEHDTEMRSPGQVTPAAGWIEELKVEGGAIWGRAVWTQSAANAIAAREWRFLSPVLWHRRDTDPREVVGLASVGLTHRPNLDLKALNRAAATTPASLEPAMKDKLIAALGLAATAEEDAIVAAVNALKGGAVDLEKFVPRAQVDDLSTRLAAANARLAEVDRAALKARAEALVGDAIAAGKIAPSAREPYLALAANNFDQTAAAIAAMPVVLQPGADTKLPAETGSGGGATGLTETERAVCASLGLKPEEFIAARA